MSDFMDKCNTALMPITQHLIHKYYDHMKIHKISNNEDDSFKSTLVSFFHRWYYSDQKNIMVDKLLQEKQHATSYGDWLSAAIRLDELTHKDEWKKTETSSLYDFQLVKEYTRLMKTARELKDWSQLLYLIRTTWVRNLGNMGNVNLYRHSHMGTKTLIEEYLEESKKSLHDLVYNSDLDENYLLGMLIQTRKNIGRTALVLSGGGTFGLFHIGVLSTLFEQDLLPRVISGSSAGAIVASILCIHHKHEIVGLIEEVLQKDFNIFQDDSEKTESENFLIKISRFFKDGTWFDNKHLINTMIEFLGDLTFREAFNRTGKILNITVSPASVHEQPRLLNNLTAPNVLVWSAVCASCSLPGIFPSTPLYEKDPRTGNAKEWNNNSVKFVDGSVDNDIPISKLSEMFNVDHIIACQVNIHVFPVLKLSVSCVGGEIEDEFSARFKQNLGVIYRFIVNEIIHLLEIGTELGIATNALTKFRSVLSQQYSGDITILPDMKMLFRINELLSNPTKEFLLREIVNGARATWPKISIIKNHCEQEFELDKAINYLKGKIISKPTLTNKNLFHFTDNSVSLIGTPILNDISNNTTETLHTPDSIISSAYSADGMIGDEKRPFTSGKSALNLNIHRSKLHSRRRSETHERIKFGINHLNHAVNLYPSISDKIMPTVIGYYPKIERKSSVGSLMGSHELQYSKGVGIYTGSYSAGHHDRKESEQWTEYWDQSPTNSLISPTYIPSNVSSDLREEHSSSELANKTSKKHDAKLYNIHQIKIKRDFEESNSKIL